MKILGAVWPLEKEFLQLRETGMSHFPCSQRGFQNLIFSHSFFLGLCQIKAIAIDCIAILLFLPTLLSLVIGICQNFGSLKTLTVLAPHVA
jgi:hypothetical protein